MELPGACWFFWSLGRQERRVEGSVLRLPAERRGPAAGAGTVRPQGRWASRVWRGLQVFSGLGISRSLCFSTSSTGRDPHDLASTMTPPP